jgi:hypothetical protein
MLTLASCYNVSRVDYLSRRSLYRFGTSWLPRNINRLENQGYICLVGAQACPAKNLSTYDILVFVLLVAKILVAYKKLPTNFTFPSKLLPIFWPTWG